MDISSRIRRLKLGEKKNNENVLNDLQQGSSAKKCVYIRSSTSCRLFSSLGTSCMENLTAFLVPSSSVS